MQPQEQVKVEEKIVQPQTETIQPKVEAEPPIKSEENKANWAEFRKQREAERKAREEADRRAEQKAAEAEALRQALEALTNKPSNNHQMPSEDIEESEEARIEKKVQLALQREREKYEKEKREREAQEMPSKLRQHFSDFDKVCTTENLDYLEYHYPEVAAPYSHLPDSYDKWAAVYKAVKRFVPNPDSAKDAHKVEKNLAKPASISAPGVAQGGNALSSPRLTEERKASNWERMQKAMRGLS